ncbi:hypothetical protein [Psychromonas antarctica]|uniref:hypothetical protein n=1 Tax=Psychromonas antarctica TaxID=67573 RepID=UPI001EE992C8|nr:hypothetical protein [Psychromonas antarctica]MCG6202779.1 hypothetical protein [Psychromonas antarctica]
MSIMYPIKRTFEKSRAENKIIMVLPEFVTTLFYAVSISSEGQGVDDLVLTKSFDNAEMCVTISPNLNLVEFPEFNVLTIRGRDILKIIPENSGVIVVYENGADYLTSKQVALFKQVID